MDSGMGGTAPGPGAGRWVDFAFSGEGFPYIRRVIDTDEKLAVFLPSLSRASWVALDTEADSLHAYPEKLCLLQLSFPGVDQLVDPLADFKLQPLFDILKQHELIMHGADYDLRLFRKDCGFVPTAIFDTMLASRLLGCREFGLVNLVSKYLGVTLEKGPQKANWARRPLTERMETYAKNDTRYLKPLSDFLSAELKSKGRLTWHRESCNQLIADCSVLREADPDQVWRVKGSHHLSPQGLAVLREIWHWRETEAITANRPPYFILPPEIMVKLAAGAVAGHHLQDLFPHYLTPRRRKGVAKAVATGLTVKPPPSPLRRKGRRLNETEKRRLHEFERRRNRRAEELGIDPTLIASRATLVALGADWNAHQAELLPWQKELLS
ncbi:MAG TPA: HRDC domain-containing protein [Verrucomicrobiae bacterium]|nr:HRDC domain-containing protein [Verrucomicrobiae bacterium]